MTQYNIGTLYGIGVGPGDPDLLTLKAVKTLQQVDVVFSASASQNTFSIATKVVAQHLKKTADIRTLGFAMSHSIEATRALWQENAQQIYQVLKNGQNAAFLTLGDPMIYSTYGYILHELRLIDPATPVVTIPGITSFQAAAARISRPLVAGDASLLITSATNLIANAHYDHPIADNMVIMKSYKQLEETLTHLEQHGYKNGAQAVLRCSWGDEQVIDNIDDLRHQEQDYWTLILCNRPAPLAPETN